jgi:hypothetical protein
MSRAPETVVKSYPSRELERLRALGRFLDSAIRIPGTQFRFGLDPIIGLIPFIGDAIGALFSFYIIVQAARLGAPNSTLTRMIGNVGLDTLLGEIPLLGDLFDFSFRSNTRNLALLESHLQQPAVAQAHSRKVLALLALGLILLLVAVVALGILVAQYILRSLS